MVSIAVYHDCGRTYQVRVIDLFREWDEDGDGTVSKKEFRKAMPLLGLEVPKTNPHPHPHPHLSPSPSPSPYP